MKKTVLQDTQRILDLIAKRDLDDDGKIIAVFFLLELHIESFFFYLPRKEAINR